MNAEFCRKKAQEAQNRKTKLEQEQTEETEIYSFVPSSRSQFSRFALLKIFPFVTVPARGDRRRAGQAARPTDLGFWPEEPHGRNKFQAANSVNSVRASVCVSSEPICGPEVLLGAPGA